MRWKNHLVALLVLINAGYMVFDGAHAFVTGDYVTPKSGPGAGRLGPWSKLVEVVGLDPRSNMMKGIFIFQGAVMLALLIFFLAHRPWAANALKVAAIAGLWYVPVGTLINMLILVLLFI